MSPKQKGSVGQQTVWQFPEGDLYLGDCLKVMRKLPDDCCSLICGSPPYEKARTYLENGVDLNIARNVDEWVDWLVEVYVEGMRICTGMVALVVGHGVTKDFRWSGGPALLCAALIKKGICLRDPKWYKRYGITGSGGPDDLAKLVEWIICATRGGRLPWSDPYACGKPWKYKPGGQRTHRTVDGKRVNKHKHWQRKYDNKSGDVVMQKVEREIRDTANPGNIIDCGSVGGGKIGGNIPHENEAPFPIDIPRFFIKTFCKPGDIVLDPYMGSGTTAAAAIENKRKFIGIDLRQSQIDLSIRRVRQAQLNKGFALS